MRRVIFRTEATSVLGIGHLKRCFTLAKYLSQNGAVCIFAVSNETLRMLPTLENDFEVFITPPCKDELGETKDFVKSSDIVVVDSYELGCEWEKQFKDLVVVDDLNREHQAKIIIDQNYRLEYSSYYLKSDAIKLLGPKYAILEPSYNLARQDLKPYHQRNKNILVSFGGSFQKDLIISTVRSLRLDSDWNLHVIIGSNGDASIAKLSSDRIKISNVVPSLSDALATSQIAIGAGGVTNWERICLGVPSLVFTIAANQKKINADLSQAGYIVDLGEPKQFDFNTLSGLMEGLIANIEGRIELNKILMSLVDGLGVQYIGSKILNI